MANNNNNEYIIKIGADIKNLKKDIKAELAGVLREVDSVGDAISKGITPDTKEFENKIASLESKMERLAKNTKNVEDQVSSMKTAFKGFAELEASMKVIGEQNKAMYDMFVKMTPYLHEFSKTFTAMKPEQAGAAFASIMKNMSVSGNAGTQVFKDMQNAAQQATNTIKNSTHEIETTAINGATAINGVAETTAHSINNIKQETKEAVKELERLQSIRKTYNSDKDYNGAQGQSALRKEIDAQRDVFRDSQGILEEAIDSGSAYNKELIDAIENAHKLLALLDKLDEGNKINKKYIDYKDGYEADVKRYIKQYKDSFSVASAEISKVELKPLKLKVDLANDDEIIEQINKALDRIKDNVKINPIKIPLNFTSQEITEETTKQVKKTKKKKKTTEEVNIDAVKDSFDKEIEKIQKGFEKIKTPLLNDVKEWRHNLEEYLTLEFKWKKGDKEGIIDLFDDINHHAENNPIWLNPDTEKLISEIENALTNHEFKLNISGSSLNVSGNGSGAIPVAFVGGTGTYKAPIVQGSVRQSSATSNSVIKTETKKETASVDANSKTIEKNSDVILDVINEFKTYSKSGNETIKRAEKTIQKLLAQNEKLDKKKPQDAENIIANNQKIDKARKKISDQQDRFGALRARTGVDVQNISSIDDDTLYQAVLHLVQDRNEIVDVLNTTKIGGASNSKTFLTKGIRNLVDSISNAQQMLNVEMKESETVSRELAAKDYLKDAEQLTRMGMALKTANREIRENIVPTEDALQQVIDVFGGRGLTSVTQSAQGLKNVLSQYDELLSADGGYQQYVNRLNDEIAQIYFEIDELSKHPRKNKTSIVEKKNQLTEKAYELGEIRENVEPVLNEFKNSIKGLPGQIADLLKGYKFIVEFVDADGKKVVESFNDASARAPQNTEPYYKRSAKMFDRINAGEITSITPKSTPNDSAITMLYGDKISKTNAVQKVIDAYDKLDTKARYFVDTLIDINKLTDENVNVSQKWAHIEESGLLDRNNRGQIGRSLYANSKFKKNQSMDDFLDEVVQAYFGVVANSKLKASTQKMLMRGTPVSYGTSREATVAHPEERNYRYTSSDRTYRTAYDAVDKSLDEYKADLLENSQQLDKTQAKIDEYNTAIEAAKEAHKQEKAKLDLIQQERNTIRTEYEQNGINSDNFIEYRSTVEDQAELEKLESAFVKEYYAYLVEEKRRLEKEKEQVGKSDDKDSISRRVALINQRLGVSSKISELEEIVHPDNETYKRTILSLNTSLKTASTQLKSLEQEKARIEQKIYNIENGVTETSLGTPADSMSEETIKIHALREVEKIDADLELADKKIQAAEKKKKELNNRIKVLQNRGRNAQEVKQSENAATNLATQTVKNSIEYKNYQAEIHKQFEDGAITWDEYSAKIQSKIDEIVTKLKEAEPEKYTGKSATEIEALLTAQKKVQQDAVKEAKNRKAELVIQRQEAIAFAKLSEEELTTQRAITEEKKKQVDIVQSQTIKDSTSQKPSTSNTNNQFKSDKDLINAYLKQSGLSDKQIDPAIDSIGAYFNKIHQTINEKYAKIDALRKEWEVNEPKFFGTDDPYEKERIRKDSVGKENEIIRTQHEIEALEKERNGLVDFINANGEYYSSSSETNRVCTNIIAEIDAQVVSNEQRIAELQALIDAHPEIKDKVIGRDKDYPFEVPQADLEIKKLKQRNESYRAEKDQIQKLDGRAKEQSVRIDNTRVQEIDNELSRLENEISQLNAEVKAATKKKKSTKGTKKLTDKQQEKVDDQFLGYVSQIKAKEISNGINVKDVDLLEAINMQKQLNALAEQGNQNTEEYLTLQRQLSELISKRTNQLKGTGRNGYATHDEKYEWIKSNVSDNVANFYNSDQYVAQSGKFDTAVAKTLGESLVKDFSNEFKAQCVTAAKQAYDGVKTQGGSAKDAKKAAIRVVQQLIDSVEQGVTAGVIEESKESASDIANKKARIKELTKQKTQLQSEKDSIISRSTIQQTELPYSTTSLSADQMAVQAGTVIVGGIDGSGPWALETTLGKTNDILNSIKNKVDSFNSGSGSNSDPSTSSGEKKNKKSKIDIDTAKNALYQAADDNLVKSFGEGTKSVRKFNEDTLKLYETLTLANGETVKFTYSINKMDGSVKSSYTTVANFEKVAKQAYAELGKNQVATKQMFDGLNFPEEKVTAYNNAITVLDNKLKSLGSKGVTDPNDAAEVETLTGKVKKLRTELEVMAKSSAKLASQNDLVKTFDADEISNVKRQMEALAQEVYGAGITVNGFNTKTNELVFSVKTEKNELTTLTYKFDELTNSVYKTGQASKTTTGFFKSFFSDVGRKVSELARYYTGMSLLTEAFQRVRQGVQYVRDIDIALTELKKVTDESESSYHRFLQTMSETASVVGSTVKDLTNSAAAWARLGYSMEEAGELAKNTAILLNVSEFESEEQATEALISSLQAFNYEANESIKIVDKLNIIGNNFAISSDGIAEGLSRSASTLVAAGNSLEESIAMLAAGNKVQQDPEGLGNALKVLSMRIRGTKTDLEEAGEDAEGMIENTSKLQEKVKALTDVDGSGGVDILTDTGAYKSTYQILLEIAEVWDRINEADPKNQAALLEILAGKTRGSQVASILQNPKDLKKAYEMALDSNGSAQKELDTYLNSIQGRIDLFTNELQTFWMNLINSNVIKFVVDAGTTILRVLNGVMDAIDGVAEGWGSLGVIVPAIATKIGASFFMSKNGIKSILDLPKFIKNLAPIQSILKTLSIDFAAIQMGATAASSGLTGFSKIVAGLKGGLSTLIAGINPVIAGLVAISAVAIIAYDALTTSHKEYVKQIESSSEELEDIRSRIKSLNDELETTKDHIDELDDKDALSFTEEQELIRLREQKKELEDIIALEEAREKREQQKQVEAAIGAAKTDKNLQNQVIRTDDGIYSNARGEGTTSSTSGNLWEQNLTTLKNAKESLDKAQKELNDAVSSGMDTNSQEFKNLEKNVENAEKKVNSINTTIDGLETNWKDTYGDVGYIEDATTEQEKAWNEMYRKHQEWLNKQAFINEDFGKADILNNTFGSYATDAAKEFKTKFEEGIKEGKDPSEIIKELINSGDYTSIFDGLSTYDIDSNDIARFFTQTGEYAEKAEEKITATIMSLDALTTSVEAYKTALQIVNEITHDGQAISEDYYNTLKEQLSDVTVGQEDFSDAIDTSNGYIVKNVSLLNKLVNQSKKSQRATIQTAKAQAQLQYAELVQKMRTSIIYMGAQATAYSFVSQAVEENRAIMEDQLDTLKQTIQQYALLEISLSDAANAFDEYEKAKERDAQLTYDDSMLEMLKTIDEGLLKNETGTEAFEYAVRAVIPEKFWKDIDDVDEKIKSIHDYIDGDNVFSRFFYVDEESGDLDITTDNVREFVDLCIGSGLFDGNSKDFALNNSVEGIEDFANKLGVTESVALAMLTALEKVDAKWGNILTDVTMTPFDRGVHSTVQTMAELNSKFADGSITAKEYAEQMAVAEKKLEDYTQKAKTRILGSDNGTSDTSDDTLGFIEVNKKVAAAQKEVEKSTEALVKAQKNYNEAKESGASEEELKTYENAINKATDKVNKHTESWAKLVEQRGKYPTEYEIELVIADIDKELETFGTRFNKTIKDNFHLDENGYYIINTGVNIDDLDKKYPGIKKYIELLNSKTEIQAFADTSSAEEDANKLKATVDGVIQAIEDNLITLELDEEAVKNIVEQANKILSGIAQTLGVSIVANMPSWMKSVLKFMGFNVDSGEKTSIVSDASKAPSSAAVSSSRDNSAYYSRLKRGNSVFAKGSDGLKTNEHNAVVGELGTEMVVDPTKGVYYTVGENGTEMVDLPKGAIIYNHKQTEELFKKGYTSRGQLIGGLSFANGNAHVGYGIPSYHPNLEDSTSLKNYTNVNTNWMNATSTLLDSADSLADASDSLNDASDAFKDAINWIDVLFTRIENNIAEQEAYLETLIDTSGVKSLKDSVYNSVYGQLYSRANASLASRDYYRAKAEAEMAGLPADIQNKIRNGAVQIQDFVGTGDEASDDSLQKYVEKINQAIEYYDKISEYEQQYWTTITEIADKAVQHQEDIAQGYENEIGLTEHLNNTLEARNDLLETKEGFAAEVYYDAQINANEIILGQLQNQRKAMQAVLDEEVRLGHVKIGSQQWFDMQQAIYDVDDAIIDTEASIEDLNNSINDLKWAKFDELINRFEYLEEEISNVVQLLSHDPDGLIMKELRDLTTDNWATDSGLSTIGLYAQEMERAQYVANQYASAIKQLEKDYTAGKYNETEYLSKLNELINAQYENIEKYYDAKDAIIELNEARVDAIRDGIEKEIDAYSELIDKKKELLDSEQALHDFNDEIKEKEKEVSDIRKQLAAMAGDTTAATTAKRKQLEEELINAQKSLEDSYYSHAMNSKQEALDKEFASFEEEKQKEIESWENWLLQTETVLDESLTYVKENTQLVFTTLTEMGEQYGLTLSTTLTQPWTDGQFAVDNYSTNFETAISSFTEQLDALVLHWDDVASAAERAARAQANALQKEYKETQQKVNNATQQAVTQQPTQQKSPAPAPAPSTNNQKKQETYTVKKGDTLWDIAKAKLKDANKWRDIYELNKDIIKNPNLIYPGQKLKLPMYAKGTLGIKKDGWAFVDELGEELVINTDGNGRLSYFTKGTGIVPADLTENLMKLAIDPTSALEDMVPTTKVPNVTANSFTNDLHFDSLVHVDSVSQETLPKLKELVRGEFNYMMKQVNNGIKRTGRSM